ncbi:F-box/kelch-repeat protein At3g23880-like [Herrania umbratica]|uniref:F-box/kelch-repeat protein At3g23880-like n=1 Tax=Herrania umbratica TaxID=108875 RepID=A0A6J1AL98_9ROSI|nr:F-box/kelch-repeat protein At3g23880-like [Herrania umbratica]
MSKQGIVPCCFPEEILLQIFCNLPIKSLGKCMCVCKAWNCLIKDTSFISSHLNNQFEKCSRNNNHNLLLLITRVRGGGGFKSEYFLHFDDQELSEYTQLQYGPLYYHDVVGSCNGLLCLVNLSSSTIRKFMLCNPIIRKWVRLPRPRLGKWPCQATFGFGFDSRRNDYKVLKITKNSVTSNIEAELYSLKKNLWEILAPPKYDLYSVDYMFFVNGVVHWIGFERLDDDGQSSIKCLLLGFDMSNEVFKEIILPESLSNVPHSHRSRLSRLYVVPYAELSSIAVIEDCFDGERTIWVMKKYGVIETWTKLFRFGRTETRHVPRVLWLRKNGGSMLTASRNWQVFSHDVESNEIQNLEIQGEVFYVFSYVESLVFLDQVIDARSKINASDEVTDDSSDDQVVDAWSESNASDETTDDSSDDQAIDAWSESNASDETTDDSSDDEEDYIRSSH